MTLKYIFHHIPKCGGTSMKKSFSKWFRCRNDYRPPWAAGRRLERFSSTSIDLDRLNEGSMICGHFEVDSIYLHQRYPNALNNPEYRIITFVREPLSLRLSLLRHEIDHGRISGDEPIESLLFDRQNWLAERFQCSEENLEDTLDRYFFIGISEESQAGFDWLARTLGKKQVTLPRRNATRPRSFPISDSMRQRFYEIHALDCLLYRCCLARWEARS